MGPMDSTTARRNREKRRLLGCDLSVSSVAKVYAPAVGTL